MKTIGKLLLICLLIASCESEELLGNQEELIQQEQELNSENDLITTNSENSNLNGISKNLDGSNMDESNSTIQNMQLSSIAEVTVLIDFSDNTLDFSKHSFINSLDPKEAFLCTDGNYLVTVDAYSDIVSDYYLNPGPDPTGVKPSRGGGTIPPELPNTEYIVLTLEGILNASPIVESYEIDGTCQIDPNQTLIFN